MEQMELIGRGLSAGIWEGFVSAPAGTDPRIAVTHLGQPVEGVELASQGDGQWALRIPVPAAAITDGVHTVVISDADSGAVLGSFALIAGEPLAEDLRAEISLLRAELDLLKKAFRRHAATPEQG
jgi:hypothetical protein